MKMNEKLLNEKLSTDRTIPTAWRFMSLIRSCAADVTISHC